MKKTLTGALALVGTLLTLSSCGSSTPKVDVCKQVMQIVGRFTDLQLKSITDPNVLAIDATKTITELKNLAQGIPEGSQRDYVNLLAQDYELISKRDSGMEAAMAFAADVRKISIVCPN